MRYSLIIGLLLLAGCGGRAAVHVASPSNGLTPQLATPAAVPVDDTLAFPVDHVASTLTGQVILGKDTQSRSASAVIQGDTLGLPAGAATQFAVYEFSGLTLPPDHLDVIFNGAGTTQAWLGLANFTTQRWELRGPFSSSQFVALSATDNVSALGNVYCAVVVEAGQTATVNQLQLYTGDSAPVAAVQATPASGAAPLLVTLDASGSTEIGNALAFYEWDWEDDGHFDASTTQPTIQHTYTAEGSYTARVRVTDSRGATGVATTEISVSPLPVPVAAFVAAPAEGYPGDPVDLDAAGSSSPGDTIVSYEWDLNGDGLYEVNAGQQSRQSLTLPSAAGHVNVGLRITCANGTSATAVRTLTSTNQPRVAVCGDSAANAPFLCVRPAGASLYDIQLNVKILYGSPGFVLEYNPDFSGNGQWTSVADDATNPTDPMPAGTGYPASGKHFPTVRVFQPVRRDYDFAVRVTDTTLPPNSNRSAIYQFPHKVSLRPLLLASFTASPASGAPGQAVQLDAAGSADNAGTIVKYEWDLDGDGIYEVDGGTATTQSTTLPSPAANAIVRLRVTDSIGNVALAERPLSSLPVWQALMLNSAPNFGNATSLALVNGKPAMAYVTGYAVTFSARPTVDGSGTWNSTTVGSGGSYASLAVVNGCPAVSYQELNGFLKFAYCDVPDGSSGWKTVTVDFNANDLLGKFNSLAVINGKPAISYMDFAHQCLKYAYSAKVDGSSGWTALAVNGVSAGGWATSLAEVNGHPAISYQGANSQLYAYSSVPDGSSAWQTLMVDPDGAAGYHSTSLVVVDGCPAISYYDGQHHHLKYACSTDPDGAAGWSSVTVDSAADSGYYSSLCVVNGYPAISYYLKSGSSPSLRYAYSSAANGSAGWLTTGVDSAGDVGAFNSLALLAGGQPAISYFDITNQTLKFAAVQ